MFSSSFSQVNVGMVMKTLKENGERAIKLICKAVTMIAHEEWKQTIQELSVSYYTVVFST